MWCFSVCGILLYMGTIGVVFYEVLVHDWWPVFYVGGIFWVQVDHGRSWIRGMLGNKA
jgi:hypothetical protein